MAAYDEVIELRLGAPGWYPGFVWLGFVLVLLNLWLVSLEWPYALSIVLVASAIVANDHRHRRKQRRYSALRVYPNRTAVLILDDQSQLAVKLGKLFWVSPVIIVAAVDCETEGKHNLLIARQHNHEQSYRRFSVLCRFAFGPCDLSFQ